MATGWELLEAGEFASALQQFRREYDEDPDFRDPTRRNMAVTYFCMHNFDSARAIYDSLIEENPKHSSGDYGGAGVARWLLGDQQGAVETWNAGLDCEYASAGGMDIPILLYFAAVKMHHESSRVAVIELIRKRLEHPFARNWPGPIGQFIVGKIDERTLRGRAVAEHPIRTARQSVQAEFYIAVQHLADGDATSYAESIRRCARFRGVELEFEWYLARGELGE